MPRRDYAHPPQYNRVNKALIIILIFLCLIIAGGILWFLKEKGVPVAEVSKAQENAYVTAQPKTTLPSRPEEVYSYIRDLETREIPVSQDEKYLQQQVQLNAKQEQLLKEQKALADKRFLESQAGLSEQFSDKTTITPAITQSAEQELAAQKANEIAKKVSEENKKQEQPKDAKLKQNKPTETASKQIHKFGLQCGAFKNRAQAENMQARLVMSGYNARINANAEWNRVVVGPIGDRAAAATAQSNAKTVADCVIIGM